MYGVPIVLIVGTLALVLFVSFRVFVFYRRALSLDRATDIRIKLAITLIASGAAIWAAVASPSGDFREFRDVNLPIFNNSSFGNVISWILIAFIFTAKTMRVPVSTPAVCSVLAFALSFLFVGMIVRFSLSAKSHPSEVTHPTDG